MNAEKAAQFDRDDVLPVNQGISLDSHSVDEAIESSDTYVSEVAERRYEMLSLWKQAGLQAVVEKYGDISEQSLYRWQSMLRNANGRISILNPAVMEPKLDLEKDFPEIVEKFLPESSYVSSIQEPNSDRVHKVIDVNVIRNVLKQEIPYRGGRVSRRKILDFLIEKYKNEKVLTREQVENKDFLPKKLFYVPRSAPKATNSIEISYDNSHIGLWDITNGRLFGPSGSDLYPTEDGSPLSFFEAKFAYVLFHPKYAGARRNAADDLLLARNPEYDPEDETSERSLPITRGLLRAYGIDVRHGTNEARHTISGMLQALPNLVQQKELRPEDF
jgi:hypothetical protein